MIFPVYPNTSKINSTISGCHKISKNETIHVGDKDIKLDNSIIFLTGEDGKRKAFLIGEEVAKSGRNNFLKRAYDLETGNGVALKIGRGQKDIEDLIVNEAEAEPEEEIVKKQEALEAQHVLSREEQRETRALAVLNRFQGNATRKLADKQVKKYLAQDFVEGGDLSKYIKEKQDFLMGGGQDPKALAAIFQEVLQTSVLFVAEIQKVHDTGYLHRDIKPANMIMTKDENGVQLTVIDFGGMIPEAEIDGKTDNAYGSGPYLAPELPGKHTKATDTYSTGKSLNELRGLIEGGAFAKVRLRNPGKGAYAVLDEMIAGLTHKDPEQRMTLPQALEAFKKIAEFFPEIKLPKNQAEVKKEVPKI